MSSSCMRLIFVIVFGITSLFITGNAHGATLSIFSDTITTSRPSASAPLAGNQAASASQVTIADNGSIFLASDSATLRPDTGETLNTVTVASQSAANTPSSNQRIVYFAGTAANTHHSGDPIVVPITAMHTISFNVPSTVPSGGKIVIQFPALTSGDANNPASPSATTFQLNALSDTNVKAFDDTGAITFTGSYTNPTAGNSTTITLGSIGANIDAGSTVKIYLGCSSATSTSCSTQIPTIINPTKSAAAGTGDQWSVLVKTQDGSSVDIDTGTIRIATIDSVLVYANVEPTLTFTIAGINNNTAINTGNTTGCTNTETTRSGYNSSATFVNLGVVSTSDINIAAQLITITTNGINGYSLTATSSGHLINASAGKYFSDSTTPGFMTAGTSWFGIHACGLDVSTGTWGSGATGGGAGAKYGWPTQATSVTLASDATGPIGNSIVTGNGLTSVEYAATPNSNITAGLYQAVITYVTTATF